MQTDRWHEKSQLIQVGVSWIGSTSWVSSFHWMPRERSEPEMEPDRRWRQRSSLLKRFVCSDVSRVVVEWNHVSKGLFESSAHVKPIIIDGVYMYNDKVIHEVLSFIFIEFLAECNFKFNECLWIFRSISQFVCSRSNSNRYLMFKLLISLKFNYSWQRILNPPITSNASVKELGPTALNHVVVFPQQ